MNLLKLGQLLRPQKKPTDTFCSSCHYFLFIFFNNNFLRLQKITGECKCFISVGPEKKNHAESAAVDNRVELNRFLQRSQTPKSSGIRPGL